MSDESILQRSSETMLERAIDCMGDGLVSELVRVDRTDGLSFNDLFRLATAVGFASQIEARYGPSSARLWFDDPNPFLNSGDEIRPIEMLASNDPDRYSKLQCALNIHLGEPLYDQ